MQSENKIFDDLAKVASSAFGNMVNMKKEIENMVKHNFERFMAKMDFVSRDEFEAVKEMAAKARLEQEKLEKRIKDLEGNINAASKSNGSSKKNGKK